MGQKRLSLEDGLARPDLVYLLDVRGKDGDFSVIAVTKNSKKMGSAWYRSWSDELHFYGFISPEIPELSIAVREEFRRQGIGHLLLDVPMKSAAHAGVQKLSLSVELEILPYSFTATMDFRR